MNRRSEKKPRAKWTLQIACLFECLAHHFIINHVYLWHTRRRIKIYKELFVSIA